MKHTFIFKNENNFGHYIYDIADEDDVAHGYLRVDNDNYTIYVKCSKKQLKIIIEKAEKLRVGDLKEKINKAANTLNEYYDELNDFILNDGSKLTPYTDKQQNQ